MELFLLLCLASALLLIFVFTLKSLLSSKSGSDLPLPPGSMGWPYVGETFQLYSQNPNVFFASKQRRYQYQISKLS